MAKTKYTYSISTDFTGLIAPYTKPDIPRLTQEIQTSNIVTALDYIGITGDLCDIWFKAELSAGDQTILDGIVAAHTGQPIAEKQPTIGEFGEMLVSNRPLPATLDFYEANKHMVNLTDPCTWYDASVEVAEDPLVDDDPSEHKIWKGTYQNWIDLSHHRVMNEELLPDVAKYQVLVEVDSGGGFTPLTQIHNIWDPTANAGAGDYDYGLIGADEYFVKFDEGRIVFGASQEGNTIRASYYRSTAFLYILGPAAGKVLEIRDAEIQGAVNLVYTCSIAFQLWGNDPAHNFDPAYPKVPWDYPMVIGTQWNFLSEGRGNYPPAEPVGGNYHFGQVSRGMVNKGVIMPFPYNTSKILKSSLGMEMRVYFMEGDGPWLGEFGNATFYCYEYADADWIEP